MTKDLVVEDYRDSYPARVARFFTDKGYWISNPDHCEATLDSKDGLRAIRWSMGIMQEGPPGFFRSGRAILFAMIQHSGSSPLETWRIAIYGRQFIQEIKALAGEIKNAFGVNVTIVLEKETPYREALPSDGIL